MFDLLAKRFVRNLRYPTAAPAASKAVRPPSSGTGGGGLSITDASIWNSFHDLLSNIPSKASLKMASVVCSSAAIGRTKTQQTARINN